MLAKNGFTRSSQAHMLMNSMCKISKNLQFCPYTAKYGSLKTRSFAYLTEWLPEKPYESLWQVSRRPHFYFTEVLRKPAKNIPLVISNSFSMWKLKKTNVAGKRHPNMFSILPITAKYDATSKKQSTAIQDNSGKNILRSFFTPNYLMHQLETLPAKLRYVPVVDR